MDKRLKWTSLGKMLQSPGANRGAVFWKIGLECGPDALTRYRVLYSKIQQTKDVDKREYRRYTG